ncbi:MAG: heme ABC transporter ATP-binding protein, partial [Candidatus Syntropharchaeia archaeon]
MLDVRGVDASYGSELILKSIDFKAERGELLGVIGPNGSGKTTLLRTITRILKPKVGTVFLDGRDVFSMKDREFARNVASVSQDTEVSFDFSVLDIVLMGRTPHLGRLEVESEKDLLIAKRCMELTNTWHLADRSITEISGGERQRVIIARALTQEPKVLLLDEPTSHLDINYQIEIMELIKRLTVEKKLIVISVIHDLNLASQYADRLILLDKGRIFAMGKPEEVLTRENIKRVFRVDVLVKKHPVTELHYIISLPITNSDGTSGKRIHLICGGGEGAPLMHLLSRRYEVTAGVINLLDTDWEVAEQLGIKFVSEAPFSPITEESHQENLKLIDRADVVVLCNIPFGFGNLKNLEAAEFALKKKKVIIMEETPIEKRDFTGGEATRRFLNLKKEGIVVKSEGEV